MIDEASREIEGDEGAFSDEEMAAWVDPPGDETVRIGKMKVVIGPVLDSTTIARINYEIEARKNTPVLLKGKPVELEPDEKAIFTWLQHGLKKPKLSMIRIFQLSRFAGVDVILAGSRVMALSGAFDEAVDRAKNGSSGEESGPSEDVAG